MPARPDSVLAAAPAVPFAAPTSFLAATARELLDRYGSGPLDELSDIVVVVREHIDALKGGRLFAYLAKLAAGPTDFSVAAATKRRRLEEASKAKATARKIAVFRERFKNVFSPTSSKRGFMSSTKACALCRSSAARIRARFP